jgi:hypothetical protein
MEIAGAIFVWLAGLVTWLIDTGIDYFRLCKAFGEAQSYMEGRCDGAGEDYRESVGDIEQHVVDNRMAVKPSLLRSLTAHWVSPLLVVAIFGSLVHFPSPLPWVRILCLGWLVGIFVLLGVHERKGPEVWRGSRTLLFVVFGAWVISLIIIVVVAHFSALAGH